MSVTDTENEMKSAAKANKAKTASRDGAIAKTAAAQSKKAEEKEGKTHPVVNRAKKIDEDIHWNIRENLKSDEETKEIHLEGNFKTWTNSVDVTGKDGDELNMLIKRCARVLKDKKHGGA